ncbi:MAG: membrane protein insertase YidC [Nitrospira sp.]|nr:membrane protein insertase YidC [Nitrospira sp.]
MDKRAVAFLVLSLAIIFGYEFVLTELGLLPPPSSTVTEEGEGAESVLSVPGEEGQAPVVASAESALPKAAGNRAEGQEPVIAKPSTIDVETNLYRAKFNTRGAVLNGWELKNFRMSSPDRPAVELVRQGGKFPNPLAIEVGDSVLTKELSEGVYRVERDFTSLDAANKTGHITFVYENEASGVRIEKRLTFHTDSYLVDIEVSQVGLEGPVEVRMGTNFGIVEWGDGFIGSIGPVSLVDGKKDVDLPDGESERKGSVQWAGLQDKYFLAVLIPKEGTSVWVKKENEKLASTAVRLPGGSTVAMQLYAGPKEYDTLEALQIGLEDSIDFGWFIFGSWGWVKAVAKPIFYVLRWINEYTGNYGVTIVLLTIIIKLLFIPLQYKSYKSMKEMQEIQPKAAALQEKFKDDRDRLNRELIKLYRDHKVNPVGGCLPMLLQMPVFVALFNVLNVAIDLRQAPFALWITDLSIQDPYYVFPVIMGGTMFIQQKITPTTMDPAQAKMMLMLPVFMTFLFINFPAGLVLYWMTLNTLNIGQQLVTEKFFSPRRPVVPAVVEDSAKK